MVNCETPGLTPRHLKHLLASATSSTVVFQASSTLEPHSLVFVKSPSTPHSTSSQLMDASSQQLFNQIASNQNERPVNSFAYGNANDSYEAESLNSTRAIPQGTISTGSSSMATQHANSTAGIVPYVASGSLSPLQGVSQTLSDDDPAYQQWFNSLWQPFDLNPCRSAQQTILDSPPQILPGIIMQSPSMSDISDPLSQHSPQFDSPTSLPISPLMERRGSGPDRNAPSSSRNSVPTPYSRCRCPKNGGKPSRHWRTACPYNPNRTEARLFECTICGQKFNRKDNLTRHLRNRHNTEPDPEPEGSAL
ncbi:hypothetical protein FRC01_010279 [Tulasnella sp. 417]|nr:hypothetical protein FRC01_010279 [Tulasnella sp. 417]